MKKLAAILALFAAAPVAAQSTPYKLLILWGNDGVEVVDYPSRARCEAALTVLQQRKQQEIAQRQPRDVPGGGMILSPPWQMEMLCIPG